MNGIEKITGKIAGDAEAEKAKILEKAADDAAAVKASYDEKAKEEVKALLDDAAFQAKERVRRAVSSLELEARKNLLAKKQELITGAFDAAFDSIMKLPEDRYVAFLCRLACEASLTGNEEVVLSPADRSRFGKQVVIGANSLLGQAKKSAALTLSQEMRPINGG
ncbi:MAG: V-type ATP synthase subunit E family protein, partial [Bacillota bacterium]|nr:V-type ATP synthase subunit E family protein [Bacillota bacterium]